MSPKQTLVHTHHACSVSHSPNISKYLVNKKCAGELKSDNTMESFSNYHIDDVVQTTSISFTNINSTHKIQGEKNVYI